MIEWNKVTWYSKWGAIIVFILVLPILTFYIGTKYRETQQILSDSENISVNNNPKPAHTINSSVVGWQTYTNQDYGFGFKYPNDWTAGIKSKYDNENVYMECVQPTKYVGTNSADSWCEGIVFVINKDKNWEISEAVNRAKIVDQLGNGPKYTESSISVGNENATLVVSDVGGFDHQLFFKKNNIGFVVSYPSKWYGGIPEQILSTFEFAD